MAQPLVYIILVNWNGKDDTLACLASLKKITWQNYRIVLVDNASSDGSVEAVGEAYPEVKIVRNPENYRFARANNQGFELARANEADFVLMLNNDVEVAPDFLEKMIAAAQSEEAVGIVGAKIYYFQQPEILWYAGGEISLWKGKIAHRGIREKDVGQFDKRSETGYVTGCCLLISRACLEQNGGLNEAYFIYVEDADFCFRAQKSGFKTMFEPSAKIWHKISASSGGKEAAGGMTAFKVRHKIRSSFQFFSKFARFYHWPTIILFSEIYFLKAGLMMLTSKNWRGLKAMIKSFFSR